MSERVRSNTANHTKVSGDHGAAPSQLALVDATNWPSPTGGDHAIGYVRPGDAKGERRHEFRYTGRAGDLLTGVTWGGGGTDAPDEVPNGIPVRHVGSHEDLLTHHLPAVPVGELTGTTAAGQLTELDDRTGGEGRRILHRVAAELVDHFIFGDPPPPGWDAVVANGGAVIGPSVFSPVFVGSPGLVALATVTTDGRAAMRRGPDQLKGAPVLVWESLLSMSQKATAAQDFVARFGLHNSTTAAEPTDGFYFQHVEGVANWQIVTANNGTRTVADSGVQPVTQDVDATVRTIFQIRCTGFAVHFFIDDVECAGSPIATNLPGADRVYHETYQIVKLVGATGRILTVRRNFLRVEYVA